MSSATAKSQPPSVDPPTALIERARLLDASLAQSGAMPLKGRHVAIASGEPESASARRFELAATALGARVSHIGPDALVLEPERQDTAARILGCLYDAIDFIPLTPERAESLQRAAGVPVFADLGGEGSPLRALVLARQDAAAAEAQLLALIKAVLAQSLA